MKSFKFILFFLFTFPVLGQPLSSDYHFLATRDWIKITQKSKNNSAEIFYAEKGQPKPLKLFTTINKSLPSAYITNLKPETNYTIWIDILDGNKLIHSFSKDIKTQINWELDPSELNELVRNPSSAAVPDGMELIWQDEFNDLFLNKNKWTDNYFSTLNYLNETNKKEMLEGHLPKPGLKLDGETINLFVNDSIPTRIYMPGGSQKISSIQTYDWRSGENLLDNSRGGYFEVKVYRSKKGNPKGLNTAFWFDSPGPDLRYYLERGTVLNGIEGIRPKGQLFEIDVFEYIHAQFVMHGHVDEKGEFQRNLNTHIAEGYQHEDNWLTHGVLWSPTSVKHYIDGKLIKEYSDKHQLYSPNHFMNTFLGSYGSEGEVSMKVDYIRYYNWPLQDNNELPNPGFDKQLAPWEGTASLAEGRNKSQGVVVKPGQILEQYVYLENNTHYQLDFWVKGKSLLETGIDNVTLVSGDLSPVFTVKKKYKKRFTQNSKSFKSGLEVADHKKIVRVHFKNIGITDLYLDDITLTQK